MAAFLIGQPTPSHSEGICPPVRRFLCKTVEVITRTDDHVLDPSSLGPLGQAEPRRLAPTRPGIREQHWMGNWTDWHAGDLHDRVAAECDCTACLPTPTETSSRMTANREGTGPPLRRSNVAETDAAKMAAGRVILRSSPPLHVAAIANGAAIISPAGRKEIQGVVEKGDDERHHSQDQGGNSHGQARNGGQKS